MSNKIQKRLLTKEKAVKVQQYNGRNFEQPEDFDSKQVQSLLTDNVVNYDNGNIKIKYQKMNRKSRQLNKKQKQGQQVNENQRTQTILQFKVQQLQKICSTLTSTNQKLLDKMEQVQQQCQYYKQQVQKHQKLSTQTLDQPQHQQSDQDQAIQIQTQLEQVQKMIHDYKNQLEKNQQKRQLLYTQVGKLQQERDNIKDQLMEFQQINREMAEQLLAYQDKNQTLLLQIEQMNANYANLQSEFQQIQVQNIRRAQSRSSHQFHTPHHPRKQSSRSFIPYQQSSSSSHFDSSVQIQLQKLIQKLVNQLEYERGMKKKITEEMKRVQKDLIDTEKDIMNKNKRIYQLEMSLLRGEKGYLFNQTNQHQHQNAQYQHEGKERITQLKSHGSMANVPKTKEGYRSAKPTRQQVQSFNRSPKRTFLKTQVSEVSQSPSPLLSFPSSSRVSPTPTSQKSKIMKTFNLLQLLNQEQSLLLKSKQKLFICLKIIDFYQKRIFNKMDYRMLMLENIIVINFNRVNLNLITIRAQFNSNHNQSNQSNQHHQSNQHNQNDQSQYEDNLAPQKAIWNLAFVLNSFLLEIASEQQDFPKNQVQQKINNQIQNMLQNKNLKKQTLSKLRNYIQSALKLRK